MTTAINIIVSEPQFRREVQLRFAEPVKLATSTAASASANYPPATYPFSLIAITNASGNKFLAVSNASAWFYVDGTPV